MHKSVLRRWIKELDSGAAGKVTLSLKNVSLTEWFNSGKEKANDKDIKGTVHA